MMSSLPNSSSRKGFTRAQLIIFYLVMTLSLATGLSLYTSATNIINLLRTATAGLFLPVLLSLILTFLLDPPVRYFERKGFNRTLGIFFVYILIAIIATLLAFWLIPYLDGMWSSLKTDLPRYTGKITGLVNELQSYLINKAPYVTEYDLPGKAKALAQKIAADILIETPKSAMLIGSLMILVPLFSFFFLRDGHATIRKCVALTPNRHFEMAHDLSFLISRQLSEFIRGRIIEAFIVGLVVAIGLSMTDIRYAPLLGAFAGITNLIPYVGPIIGMVPGILIAFADLGVGGEFWWIVCVYILIAQIIVDSFILIPIFISRVSNLHPFIVIVAIIMGGKLSGVIGMIIGVPVASIIKIAVQSIMQYRHNFSLTRGEYEQE